MKSGFVSYPANRSLLCVLCVSVVNPDDDCHHCRLNRRDAKTDQYCLSFTAALRHCALAPLRSLRRRRVKRKDAKTQRKAGTLNHRVCSGDLRVDRSPCSPSPATSICGESRPMSVSVPNRTTEATRPGRIQRSEGRFRGCGRGPGLVPAPTCPRLLARNVQASVGTERQRLRQARGTGISSLLFAPLRLGAFAFPPAQPSSTQRRKDAEPQRKTGTLNHRMSSGELGVFPAPCSLLPAPISQRVQTVHASCVCKVNS